MIDEVVRRIGETGIVSVLTAQNAGEATRAVEAISSGGIPIIETTMTVPNAMAGLSVPVLSSERDSGRLAVPGALTPTELMNAREQGAKLIKIFPCGRVGGPKYLKALKALFPDACLIPTGGVSAANAAEFYAAGAFSLGVGGQLV